MDLNKNIINKIESLLVESLENVKILSIKTFEDESILTLLECYRLFINSSDENSKKTISEISNKLKTIDFSKTLTNINESFNSELRIESKLDNLFESISNNKKYDDEYETIQKELNDLNELNQLIFEKNKIKSFLSEFDGSLKNNVVIGIFKNAVLSNYGEITENQNKYIDHILTANEDDIKNLHISNIKEALNKVDLSLNENVDDIKLLKVKNKLLTMYTKSYESSPSDKDIISVINLLDKF